MAQWLRCCATNRKVAGSIPAGVSGFFIDINSLRWHHGPGVDSASIINKYREYFLGGKVGRCVRLKTYHHPVPLSRNLGTLTSWNLSRPVIGLLYVLPYKLRSLTSAVVNIIRQGHNTHQATLYFYSPLPLFCSKIFSFSILVKRKAYNGQIMRKF